MCGLAGAVFVPGDVREQLGQALRRLRHRGPDGTQVWSDGFAWLGHTRLRILDTTPAADQPMVARDGRGVLVYNGEIYNYRELGHELGDDWRPTSRSDTEVVLEMLLRQGSSALSRFNGMWALALWRPIERRLFLARDRFGVKPLYYAALPDGGVAFASEIPALLALVGAPPEPDMEVMRRFLYYAEAEPRERTFFRGIQKLPPGCSAEISPGGLRVAPFWDLRSAVEDEELPSEPASEYRRRFREAVLMRLRSDVAVGTCLSGGLDSSSILCAVRSAADQGVIEPTFTYKAFSARHPGSRADEGPFIETVLAATSFKGYEVVPEPARFSDDLPALVRHQGEPFGSLAVYAQWCVMRLAREEGVTVLLDGQGADEVLGGYPLYAYYRLGDLTRRGRLLEALRLVHSLSRVQGASPRASIRPAVAGVLPEALRRRLSWSGRRPGAARFLSRDLQRDPPAPSRLPSVYSDRFRDALHASVTDQGLPSLLRYEDRNSMAFSVEARVPFLDWRLVTLGLRLPIEWKLHEGWTKWVLREALAADLPPAIRWRRDKKAFAAPQAEWLRGPLREWVEDILSSRSLRERGWFAVGQLSREYGSWLDGGPSIDDALWLVLSAELWAREFTGRPGTA